MAAAGARVNAVAPAGRRVAVSWSGGKDSCLALYRSQQLGAVPTALLTVFDEEGARSRSHGLSMEVVAAQADCLGLPLHAARASWQSYEARFRELLGERVATGVCDVVFGDIDLEPHREWEERVCTASGARAWLPLWRGGRRALLDEFWAAGFRCHLVAVDRQKLGRDVLGAELTPALADRFEAAGIDACGENGEFHTLVTDGPLFRAPLAFTFGDVVERSGCLAIDVLLG